MFETYVQIPLYDSYDAEYPIALEGESYSLRLYFNERMQEWFIEVRDDSGNSLIAGRRLVLNGTTWISEITGLNGFLLLEPIGLDRNETMSNYDSLFKYYKLFYIY